MGGKAFHAHEFPEKPEGDGWVASGWGLLKAAVGKKVPEEADLHRRSVHDPTTLCDTILLPSFI
uniref:Uncharacterized protein n=1 Tax=Aegilops tauschii subsp. strangulata TaxID=200361 RepID=A0A453QUB9_AEGTS